MSYAPCPGGGDAGSREALLGIQFTEGGLGRERRRLDIGTTVFVMGIAQILSTIIAARLSLFAASLWWTSNLGSEWGFYDLLGPQLMRGFAIMLCIVPSVGLALGGFEQAELRAASGLFNLMRNLGGTVGIAVVNTWLADQTRIHIARTGDSLGRNGAQAQEFVSGLAAQIGRLTPDPERAMAVAPGEFARVVGRSALTSAFDEVFQVMAWIFIAALILVPFCRPAPLLPASPPVDAH